MAERGVGVSHTTIMRWVLHYVPEYERRWARYARCANSSWRMDETAIPFAGAGIISTARSIGTASRCTRCCAAIVAWRLCRRSSATPWCRGRRDGRARLICMGIRQLTARCGYFGKSSADGDLRSSAAGSISTTSWNRIIARSSGAAPRCWASSPSARQP